MTTASSTPPDDPLHDSGESVHGLPCAGVARGARGWDEARRACNLTDDHEPAAVLYPRSTAELAATVQYAVTTGRRVALQATGRGGSLAALDDTVLIRTERMQDVEVDPRTRSARVGAGVLCRELQAAAAPRGLTFLAGPSLDVGVVGYTLGGGVGWLGRRFGLACNTVIGAQVVTADGAVRQVDVEQEPELFWALRGGGGSVAAVASLELRLVPVREVHAGTLLWPIEQAAEVLHCWRVWTAEVPDTVTSIARLPRYPSSVEVDAHLRGRHYVGIETVIAESEEDADIWLRPLRALRPAFDTIAPRPCTELGLLHDEGTRPAPMNGDHQLLLELTDGVVDGLLEHAEPGAASPPPVIEIHHLGGALGRSAPDDHGALDRIGANYAVYGLAHGENPDLADRAGDPAVLFDVECLRRLQAAKAIYDPDDRFVSSRPSPLR